MLVAKSSCCPPAIRRCLSSHAPLLVWCKSLGCPKNRVDTETLLGGLGVPIEQTEMPVQAHLVFINTCGFITPAVRESIDAILDVDRSLTRAKQRPLLVVAGCMVGRYGVKELAKEMPEVDLWLTTEEMPDWPRRIREKLDLQPVTPITRLLSTGPSYAWLKVSEGCRHHCAFCTIPSIRGTLRSLPEKNILRQAEQLLSWGVKELNLIAQDLTDYGQDTHPGEENLTRLLGKLSTIPKLQWLRLLYLYPRGISGSLLGSIKNIGRPLLPYFDIPFQHSHPDVLKNMGRPFTIDPAKICDDIRNVLPNAALRTTLIVGYPGETEAQFEHLCRFVEKMQFTQLGVFTFWPEEGAVAAELPGQIPQDIKEERRNIIMSLQKDISHDLLERFVGGTEDVLVDSVNPEWPGLHNGRAWFQAPEVDGITYISGPDVKPGAMVSADIIESSDYDLTALSTQG